MPVCRRHSHELTVSLTHLSSGSPIGMASHAGRERDGCRQLMLEKSMTPGMAAQR